MPKMNPLPLVLLLALGVTAQAAPAKVTIPKLHSWTDCVGNQTISSLPAQSACFGTKLKQADALVSRLLTELTKKNAKVGHLEQVTQTSWLKFRFNHCHAWGLVNEGGTLQEVNESGCLIEQTLQRAQELKAMLDML